MAPPIAAVASPSAQLVPDREAERLRALRRYDVLDTSPEQVFDDLVALAAQVCDAPMAAITLFESRRQWCKARLGLEACERARDGFCSLCILQSDLMVVEDAHEDPRLRSHAYAIGAPHIRFYAGVPLITPDGFAIGTLCVIDRVPRGLTPGQQDALRALGRQVMTHLELRRLVVEERRTISAQRAVQGIGLALLQSEQAADIAEKIATALCTFAGCGRAAVFGYERSSATLIGLADSPRGGAPVNAIQLELDECPVAHRAVLGGAPQHSWEVDDPQGALGQALGMGRYSCMALVCGGDTAGVAVLERPQGLDEVVLSLTALAATALGRAWPEREEPGRADAPPHSFTEQELNILRLVARGLSNPEIGARLYLSRHTVKEYCGNAMRKLGVRNRVEAALAATQLGLIGD